MKMFNHQLIATRPRLRRELRIKRMRMITRSFKKVSKELLFKRSQISNGMMYQVSSLQKRVSKKQSLCLSSSQNCSKVAESLGKVFYCTDHQAQVKVSWPKLVPPNAIVHSFLFRHQILWASGRASLKSLSKTCLKWPEKGNHQWYLLMR